MQQISTRDLMLGERFEEKLTCIDRIKRCHRNMRK